jgi:hypothetical protein
LTRAEKSSSCPINSGSSNIIWSLIAIAATIEAVNAVSIKARCAAIDSRFKKSVSPLGCDSKVSPITTIKSLDSLSQRIAARMSIISIKSFPQKAGFTESSGPC